MSPFIKQSERDKYEEFESFLERLNVPNAGELNYLIHKLCFKYLRDNEISYQTVHDVVGVLGDVEDEIRTRLMRPYEKTKEEINGDIGYWDLIRGLHGKMTGEWASLYEEKFHK